MIPSRLSGDSTDYPPWTPGIGAMYLEDYVLERFVKLPSNAEKGSDVERTLRRHTIRSSLPLSQAINQHAGRHHYRFHTGPVGYA